jgi:hypothetical protein
MSIIWNIQINSQIAVYLYRIFFSYLQNSSPLNAIKKSSSLSTLWWFIHFNSHDQQAKINNLMV